MFRVLSDGSREIAGYRPEPEILSRFKVAANGKPTGTPEITRPSFVSRRRSLILVTAHLAGSR